MRAMSAQAKAPGAGARRYAATAGAVTALYFWNSPAKVTGDVRVELPAVEEELSENWRERVTRALVSERSPMTAAVQPGPSTPFAAGRRAPPGRRAPRKVCFSLGY